MPIKPITGVVTAGTLTLTVLPGQEGELMFDGDGLNVVRVNREPFDQTTGLSAPVVDLTTPNKFFTLKPGRYDFTVPTFSTAFNLHFQVL